MSDTQYLAAKTIDEAVQAHNQANGSARFLAGGTDLLVQIKSGIKNKLINEASIIESLMSFKRAGASAIVTYFALEIIKKLKH